MKYIFALILIPSLVFSGNRLINPKPDCPKITVDEIMPLRVPKNSNVNFHDLYNKQNHEQLSEILKISSPIYIRNAQKIFIHCEVNDNGLLIIEQKTSNFKWRTYYTKKITPPYIAFSLSPGPDYLRLKILK